MPPSEEVIMIAPLLRSIMGLEYHNVRAGIVYKNSHLHTFGCLDHLLGGILISEVHHQCLCLYTVILLKLTAFCLNRIGMTSCNYNI